MNELITTSAYVGAADLMTARIRCPRIFQLERKDAIDAIHQILYKMTLYRGQSPDGQYISFTATTLYDEIISDKTCGLAYITLPEVEHAVKQAVLHKDLYISVATVFNVLTEYAKGEGHELELQYQEQRKQEAKALPANPRYAAMIDNNTNKMTQNAKIR